MLRFELSLELQIQ